MREAVYVWEIGDVCVTNTQVEMLLNLLMLLNQGKGPYHLDRRFHQLLLVYTCTEAFNASKLAQINTVRCLQPAFPWPTAAHNG